MSVYTKLLLIMYVLFLGLYVFSLILNTGDDKFLTAFLIFNAATIVSMRIDELSKQINNRP